MRWVIHAKCSTRSVTGADLAVGTSHVTGRKTLRTAESSKRVVVAPACNVGCHVSKTVICPSVW